MASNLFIIFLILYFDQIVPDLYHSTADCDFQHQTYLQLRGKKRFLNKIWKLCVASPKLYIQYSIGTTIKNIQTMPGHTKQVVKHSKDTSEQNY